MLLAPLIRQRHLDSNGNPLAGGKLYSYQSGTTTPQSTYTNQGGGTANANPVVLDANGEAAVWLDPTLSYKFVLKDSADATQWTVDEVVGTLTASAVTTVSIADLAVTTAKLAADSVTAAKLADSAATDADRAVTTDHIRNSAITIAKMDGATTSDPRAIMNASLTASMGSGALTIALKTKAGADAAAATPVTIAFRDTTAASGTYNLRTVTGALSLVVPSGATLGHRDTVQGLVHVYAIDNAGTVELACTGHRILNEGTLQTTEAIGTGADYNSGIYSTVARTGVPFRYLGSFRSTQGTAGTWSTAVSEIALTPAERRPCFWLSDAVLRIAAAIVSADPTTLGQRRELLKTNAAVTFTDFGTGTAPTKDNGFRIAAVDGSGAGASPNTNRAEYFVGKWLSPDQVQWAFYSSTGRAGRIDTSFFFDATTEVGLARGYDPATGIAFVTLPLHTSANNRRCGLSFASGTAGATGATEAYYDILVGESV